MNSGYQLMEHLAHITAFKDIRQLELSLLTALQALFKPNTLLLAKLNSENEPLQLLRYDSDNQLIKDQDLAQLNGCTQALIIKALSKKPLTASVTQQNKTISAFYIPNLLGMNFCVILKNTAALSVGDSNLLCSFLKVYRNFCLLIEDVQTDQLTGLLNRKTFEQNFQCISEDLPLHRFNPAFNERRALMPSGMDCYWMAVIDIDDFKRVNDTFGHVYGDEVLILLARIMKDCFRVKDQIYRFGGEEFVIVTQCQDVEGARLVFERLRKTVEEYDFPQIGRVTISIGIVQLQTGMLATTLFDQADQALYHVKKTGKNQVAFYQELVNYGSIQPVTMLSGDIEIF